MSTCLSRSFSPHSNSTVAAAMCNQNLRDKGLILAASRLLKIHPRNVCRGITDRKRLQELTGTGWVSATRAEYRNKIGSAVDRVISDWLHTDFPTRADNYRKRMVKIWWLDEATGERKYILHPGREFRHNIQTTFALLSGRNKHGEEILVFDVQPEWDEVIELTKTPARPNGIKGDPRIISRNKCKCMCKAKTSQCSCPACSHYVENCDVRDRRFAYRTVTANECTLCTGDCKSGMWRTFTSSVVKYRSTMMCAPEIVDWIPDVDKDTGEEMTTSSPLRMHRKKCYFGTCNHCGYTHKQTTRTHTQTNHSHAHTNKPPVPHAIYINKTNPSHIRPTCTQLLYIATNTT